MLARTAAGRWRRWLGWCAAGLIGVVLALYLLLAAPLPFVKPWWGPPAPDWNDPWYPRQRMADWLVLTRTLRGRTRQQVIDMLGEPSSAGYMAAHDMVYPLGMDRSFMGMDSEWLVLDLDDAGRVAAARVLRD